MLAVFEKTVANSPEALQSPHSSESAYALKDGSLATHFSSVNPNSVTLNFGSSGFVAYSLDNTDPRVPRITEKKMLAVFEKTVANSPEALQSPHSSESAYALKDGSLATHFSSVNPNSVTLNFGSSGFVAYSLDNTDPRVPRLFTVVDDIFCLFQGHIENLPFLKQQYGLNKITNEAIIVIEAYRTLRDRGPYPVDKVVRDFHGKFAFILFDGAKQTVFSAADADGSVPFFWGNDAEGHLVLSDNTEMMKKGCAKSFGPFPKGCFFTSSGGLRSFEHPKNELKPVPRVDSSGDVCGATFKVDAETKRESTKMPRVDSSQNWAGHI